jgi:hypothetical protein
MRRTSGFLIAGLVLLGLTAIYWLIQGVGLIFSDASASTFVLYLVLSLIMLALIIISWKRSLLGGILIATLGILMAVYFLMVKLNIYDATPFLLLMCLPLVISGLLVIEANWSARRNS